MVVLHHHLRLFLDLLLFRLLFLLPLLPLLVLRLLESVTVHVIHRPSLYRLHRVLEATAETSLQILQPPFPRAIVQLHVLQSLAAEPALAAIHVVLHVVRILLPMRKQAFSDLLFHLDVLLLVQNPLVPRLVPAAILLVLFKELVHLVVATDMRRVLVLKEEELHKPRSPS